MSADLPATDDWRRLDPKMLLVHPINEVRRLFVPLVVAGVFGATQLGPLTGLAFVAVPVLVGVGRYLTTTYRIADGRIQLRRGLLNRQRLSTPLDRVRTVDLTATVVHRLLGLTTVSIGTGSVGSGDEGDRISLDALAVEEGRALRSRLLSEAGTIDGGPDEEAAGGARPATVAAAFEPRWLRYAPFTSTGIVVLGGLLGATAQVASELQIRIDLTEEDLGGTPPAALVAGGILVVALLVLALTVLGYLVTNWRFVLSRTSDTWRLSRGLLTTRETSIDVERLAGVAVGEPPGLRLAGGARLSAIVTGLDRTARGSETLVPPAPAETVRRAAIEVLGTERPLTASLHRHGPSATRRRYVRALAPAAVVAAAPALGVAAGLSPWLLVASAVVLAGALALAVDRVRSLGHVLVDRYVVARSGSLFRKREVLATEHVIGWTLRDTWFQRRVGLVTLTATTAGGSGAVHILDVPSADAVALADTATPGLVSAFRPG